jgi:hypothetical protein
MSTTKDVTRRTIVGGAAALPAVAMLPMAAAATTEPDPIFAAIERYQKAFADFI